MFFFSNSDVRILEGLVDVLLLTRLCVSKKLPCELLESTNKYILTFNFQIEERRTDCPSSPTLTGGEHYWKIVMKEITDRVVSFAQLCLQVSVDVEKMMQAKKRLTCFCSNRRGRTRLLSSDKNSKCSNGLESMTCWWLQGSLLFLWHYFSFLSTFN